ncbi:MAG TPA: hypothetical protein VMR98_04925, partial [Candidatus Polarisedimenticolaceae bacterium]|nr:hypothetical protein [Candidatus Polarisedimenticolaceae bacterium]
MAAIPDANGTVHACYTNVIGTLRIIDSPTASCNIAETPISWNQKPNIKYAESTAEYSLTPAESEAANHSADLGGPDLTVSVPSGTGSLVKFYGNLEIKANCEVYPVVTVIDETNNDNFGNGGDAPVQIYTAGPVENYVLYTLGGGQASTGFQYTVPATAGTHTYSMRYKSTAYGENG